MGVFVVDYAWGRPGPAALKAAGVGAAIRYLSHDSTGKNLDKAEAKALSDAGIGIGVVWESTSNRALDGHAAGAQDARDAEAQAKACGMPDGHPIYFAVDLDASSGQQGAINDYLRGAASVLGVHRVGLYGGYGPISRSFDAGTITWGWQTYAWSGGQWDSRAQLQQYSNDHLINGVGVDYDRAVKADFGQWRVGQPAKPPVTPPTGPTPLKEDLMYGQLNCGVGAVTPVSFKPGTYTAVGFVADAKVDLQVECQSAPGTWDVVKATYDPAAKKGKTVIHFPHPGTTDALRIRRVGVKGVGDDAAVGWDAS
jgi:hypothetical protein